jgi:hypothetical protein
MRSLIAIVTSFLLLGAANATPAGTPPPGDYAQTCKDINVVYKGSEARAIHAQCRDRGQRYEYSTLMLPCPGHADVENNNGTLRCKPRYRPGL